MGSVFLNMNLPIVMLTNADLSSIIDGLKQRFIDRYYDLMIRIESDQRMIAYTLAMRSDQIPHPERFILEIDTDIRPRFIEIQKMFFVYNMSALEYVAVEYHKHNPMKLRNINKTNIYLRDIMRRSRSMGLITKEDFECCEGLIELRNIIVHSNSISKRDIIYIFPGDILEFRKDIPFQGTPLLLPFLTDWLRLFIRDWILKIAV